MIECLTDGWPYSGLRRRAPLSGDATNLLFYFGMRAALFPYLGSVCIVTGRQNISTNLPIYRKQTTNVR